MRRIALGVLGMATPTFGQVEIGGMRLHGDVEVGTRFFIDRPSKSEEAKFLEYRDINEGLYLHDLRLRLFYPDERYSTELAGRQWRLDDQQYSLRTGRLGTWEVGFDWDQMRHILSTNARMLAAEVDRGVFRLPTPRPDLTAYNSARELDEKMSRIRRSSPPPRFLAVRIRARSRSLLTATFASQLRKLPTLWPVL